YNNNNNNNNKTPLVLQQLNSLCLLMRGLPYSCTETEITKFFQEVGITPVRIHRKADGTEAYVEFYSIEDCSKAMTRDRNFIGTRYIELFRVTYEHMAKTVGLPLHQQKTFAPTTHNAASAFSIPSNASALSQNIGVISNIPSNFHIRQAPSSSYPTNVDGEKKKGNWFLFLSIFFFFEIARKYGLFAFVVSSTSKETKNATNEFTYKIVCIFSFLKIFIILIQFNKKRWREKENDSKNKKEENQRLENQTKIDFKTNKKNQKNNLQ
ncbi:G-rich sequence factor 1, partial [Reticulomyxa filosa]